MRIDDPIFSGSVVGSDAVVSLSGSFTGSGTIENSATASKLRASASFGLGMESFNFDGSTNQVISIDTASAHFISGALEAVAASTGSFVVTGSISGLTQSFTKGDGSTFDINLPDTGAVDLLFEITGALGVDPFTFDNTANAQVQLNTSSAHFTVGVSASQAPIITALSASLTTTDQTISSSISALSASAAAALAAQSASNAIDFVSESIYRVQTGSFVTTASISGLTQSFTKGDGTTFEINLPDTGAVDLLFEITGGLGVDPFTFDNTANAEVQVNTSSFHIANLTASLVTTASISGLTQSFTKGDGSTFEINLPDTGSPTLSNQITGALGIEAFTFNGTADAQVQVDTSSFHIANLTASLVTTASISGLTQSFTKGDGSTFEINLPDTGSVDLLYSMSNGKGVEAFTFDNTGNASVQVDTASFHVANLTASLVQTSSISGLTQSFTKGDGSTYDNLLPDTGSFLVTASFVNQTMSFSASDGSNFIVPITDTASFVTDVFPSTVNNLIAVTFGTGTTISRPVVTASYSETASHATSISGTLSNGALVDAFSFNGSDNATVDITTFDTGVSGSRTTLSASLTTTDQAISSSVASLSGSASAARDLAAAQVSGSSNALSGSASTARDVAAAQVTGSSVAPIAALSGSASAARDLAAAQVSGSSNALSGSASTARDVAAAQVTGSSVAPIAALSASTSTAREFYIITGSISGLTQSFTKGNGSTFDINLPDTGSPTLANQITGALGVDPFIFNGTADAQVQVNTSSAHFIQGASAVTASLSASLTATDQTISSSVAALSASASTSRLALSASLTATDQTISSSIVTISASLTATDQIISSSVALLSASAIINVETSSARQVDTLTITKGDGSTFDVTHDTSSFVKTVNLAQPNPVNGNVSISIQSVDTGTSASMLAASSSGTLNEGDIWVVSGETGGGPFGSGSNGKAYIFNSGSTPGSGELLPLYSISEAENDVRYVQVAGDTMTGALILSQDPTNVLGAATKQYVDPAFTTASMATGSDGTHTVTFTRLGGGTQTLTFTSASYAISASLVTASLSNGLGVETFRYNGSEAKIVQIDTSSAHFTAGVSQSFGSTFANISGSLTGSVMGTSSAVEFPLTSGSGIVAFSYVGAASASVILDTASAHFIGGVSSSLSGFAGSYSGSFTGSLSGSLVGTASRVESALTGGLGVDTFTYDGSVGRGVQINTSSLHFRTGATASIVGNVINPSSVITTKDISVVADSRISSSAESRNYVEVHDTAHGVGAMELAAIDDIYLVSNTDSGSAGDIVFASNISGTLASETMRIINNNAAANKGLVFVQNDVSASNFIGTSSISLGKASQGVAITMSTYDGSQNTIISLDTSSLAFAEGVAEGMSSASYAGLTIDFSGSNLDFTLANLSGSVFNFSGSTIDFSDVNFSGSTINWSGSNIDFSDVNFSGSTFNFSGSALDLSGAVIVANTASYSGTFNYSGSTINGGSYVGASFSGSSAFTGSFDFSNADVTGISVNYDPVTASVDTTMVNAKAYIVTNSAAVVTMTLPASPSNGNTIKLANMDDRATIIARNGNKIMGLAEDMTLNVEQVSFELMYETTSMGWVIYGARAIT